MICALRCEPIDLSMNEIEGPGKPLDTPRADWLTANCLRSTDPDAFYPSEMARVAGMLNIH